MKPLDAYLLERKGFRTGVICGALLLSSAALALGGMVYAFTTGPMAIGHYVRDRFIALSFVILSLLFSALLAWTLKSTGRPLRAWARCALSFGAPLVIAGIFVVVAFWPLLRP
jgi:hypothetical protein